MDSAFRLAIAIVICIYLSVLTSLFKYTLPEWCANPNGTGNWIIQPLCK